MASKGPECSISYESYNDKDKCPLFLGCGHTFCSRCLERLLPGNTIDCPKCRNPGTVPSGVEGLLKNFALLDMVNKTAPKQHVLPNTREKRPLLAGSRSKGSHKCEAGNKEHPANFCCLDCKENMCKTAAHSHTCDKASRDHQAVSLEELEANPQPASVSLICQKHNDKFRFFEEWCGNVVCRVEQFGHVCLPLAEAAFKYRQEVEDFIEVPKIIEDRIVDAFSKLTKDQEKGTAEIQRFLKKVCKWIILCCLDYLGLLSLVLHSQSFNWILTLVDTEFQPHTVHKTVTIQKKYPTFKLPTRAIASETRTLCFFQNLFTRNWQWNQVEF